MSIRVENLSKTIEGKSILKGVNFHFGNEFIVVLGPSGCGKTTLLRIISGLTKQTSGDVFLNEENVNTIPPEERKVGLVFQNYALFPHMSAAENIGFSIHRNDPGWDKRKDRVESIAKDLGIESNLKHKPAELSGGEQQRVSIGRALAQDAEIYLLDEPLANLDSSIRSTLRAELLALQKRLGKTFLLVTHDLVDAFTLGDRMILLNDGEVVQEGKPLEIYNRPKNLFVADFVNPNGLNRFDGEVSSEGICTVNAIEKQFAMDQVVKSRTPEIEEVVITVRPEDFIIDDSRKLEEGLTLDIDVEEIEVLGSRVMIRGRHNDTDIRVICSAEAKTNQRDKIRLIVPFEKILVFSKQSSEIMQ